MSPQTPKQVTPNSPGAGVIATLDDIWHREGPLSAADLRNLTAISQSIADMYHALDMLTQISAEDVQDLENHGGSDSSKLSRVHQARHALARYDDLTIERIDPEDLDGDWPEWAEAPTNKP